MKVHGRLLVTAKVFLFCCIASYGLVDADKANSAEVLTAKTPMTIVNIDNFINESSISPSEVVNYKETVLLSDVHYAPKHITWQTTPKCEWKAVWGTGAAHRLWKITTENGGKSYSAIGWDYLFPCATGHERGNNVPTGTRGTMLTTLCDTHPTRCNGRERTNIMFWP